MDAQAPFADLVGAGNVTFGGGDGRTGRFDGAGAYFLTPTWDNLEVTRGGQAAIGTVACA
jgi:hypothetical protein